MKLTPILHTFLNRVWSRDPKAVPAFTLSYPGALSWSVADEVLTLTAGQGQQTAIDLTQYTVGALVTYLVSQGVAVVGLNTALGSYGAIVLLDGEGDQAAPLTAYTSLRWAILDAIAKQLSLAEACAAAAPAQLATTTAFRYWLDFLGGYLGNLVRDPGELDSAYALRIPATIVQPKCNNVAIAIALQNGLGLSNVQVSDVTVQGPTAPLFDASIKFDGSHDYNATPTVEYGMFDVAASYAGPAQPTLQATVGAMIETLRASGTHVRNISLTSLG